MHLLDNYVVTLTTTLFLLFVYKIDKLLHTDRVDNWQQGRCNWQRFRAIDEIIHNAKNDITLCANNFVLNLSVEV